MSNSHHALLLYAHDVAAAATDELSVGHDAQDRLYETLGVDDAQQLVKNAYVRPTYTDVQVCIVRAQFMTLEAQNALLKVFEEPPASTRFLLVVPRDFIVLPTLLSRCVIQTQISEAQAENTSFREFLASTYAQRLALIDAAQKKKDVQWQRYMKQGLIEYVQTHTQYLKELELVVRLLLTRGASNKLLLEHAALTLPSSSAG